MHLEELNKKYPFTKNMNGSEIKELITFLVTCLMEIALTNYKNNTKELKLSIFMDDAKKVLNINEENIC